MSKVVDASKYTFLKTWGKDGYRENWAVYGKMSGHKLEHVITSCITPFANRDHVALEIGCGAGFWTECLVSEFNSVIALDVIPEPAFAQRAKNVYYVEVPDRNYDCYGVPAGMIDFVWSFGVFCHLTHEATSEYLRSIFRVCKPGAHVSLYFANIDRRPGVATEENTDAEVPWVSTTWTQAVDMLERSGFVDIVDLLPTLPDSMIGARKP